MDQLTLPEVTNEMGEIKKLDFKMRQLQDAAARRGDLDDYNRIGTERMELQSRYDDLTAIGRTILSN